MKNKRVFHGLPEITDIRPGRTGCAAGLSPDRGCSGHRPRRLGRTLAFAVYVFVPLTVLQGYFFAQAQQRLWWPRLMSLTLFALAVLSAGGIVSVTMILWLPAVQ